MKQKVQTILNREIERLNSLSVQGAFDLDQFRQLELLLRACRTLHESLPDTPAASPVAAPSTKDLLDSLHTNEGSDQPT